MPRVDFYLLPDGEPRTRDVTACRLTEKAFLAGHSVCLYAQTRAAAVALDELLWTFRAGSFLPHVLLPAPAWAPEEMPRIFIGSDAQLASAGVLINLSAGLPPSAENYARIAELVPPAEADRQRARVRYGEYRALGWEIKTHDLAQSA